MADSSKDIQLHELKDMINDLKKMIKTLQMIPEIIGRLPILTYLNPLDRTALRNILTEPKNSILITF